MKPGFVHSYFLLIYLRLSKPMYFPSRYHRKDKSKNLVYFSQTIVRKKFYKLFHLPICIFFFPGFCSRIDEWIFSVNRFPRFFSQLAQFFFIFFFNLRFIFFLSPPHLFFFRFDFVLKLYKAVSRDTDRVTFALGV